MVDYVKLQFTATNLISRWSGIPSCWWSEVAFPAASCSQSDKTIVIGNYTFDIIMQGGPNSMRGQD